MLQLADTDLYFVYFNLRLYLRNFFFVTKKDALYPQMLLYEHESENILF